MRIPNSNKVLSLLHKYLPIVLIALVVASCSFFKPRRYMDMPEDQAKLDGEPVIYKDTLASDKRKDKKKLPGKKTFYGIKTRKGFTRLVRGRTVTMELFYTVKKMQTVDKKPVELSPYVTNIYWYDRRKKVIRVGPIPEKEKQFARILHGPYRRTENKMVVEEGIFYLGAKHGRWEKYLPSEENLLVDKTKWYKGFSKESEITYYDADKKKIREVKPLIGGVLEGEYYYFSPNAVVLESGKYKDGKKVGRWQEFFENRRRLKKTYIYPELPDDTTKGYLLNEFDETGLMIYDKYTEDEKKKQGKK